MRPGGCRPAHVRLRRDPGRDGVSLRVGCRGQCHPARIGDPAARGCVAAVGARTLRAARQPSRQGDAGSSKGQSGRGRCRQGSEARSAVVGPGVAATTERAVTGANPAR